MEKKLSKKALTKSFHNWFYGHLTCFSQEHMQTFGYLCSMLPLVEDLYDEEEEKEKKKPRKRSMADSLKAVNNAGSAKIAREKEKGITIKNVEYIPEEEPFEPGRPVVSKPQTKRKAKNFLIDDDEFEFEFLNMDDRN